MDETYIKVKGTWVYLYRAVDSQGDTLDFMLSERRDEYAATAFFKQAINNNASIVYFSYSIIGKLQTFNSANNLFFKNRKDARYCHWTANQ
jgi:transposase-like protein